MISGAAAVMTRKQRRQAGRRRPIGDKPRILPHSEAAFLAAAADGQKAARLPLREAKIAVEGGGLVR